MCHVLIIEDEAVVALHLEALLREHGSTTFAFAGTEAEAVEAARGQRPALITSDVKLREGTGPRAVEAILNELGAMPVIFITASPEECVPCDPPARVLGKPIQENSVGATFRELAPL